MKICTLHIKWLAHEQKHTANYKQVFQKKKKNVRKHDVLHFFQLLSGEYSKEDQQDDVIKTAPAKHVYVSVCVYGETGTHTSYIVVYSKINNDVVSVIPSVSITPYCVFCFFFPPQANIKTFQI